MEWISVDIKPEIQSRWSKKNYLVVTEYNYYIGRTFCGHWVDMENNAIDGAKYYAELPLPPR